MRLQLGMLTSTFSQVPYIVTLATYTYAHLEMECHIEPIMPGLTKVTPELLWRRVCLGILTWAHDQFFIVLTAIQKLPAPLSTIPPIWDVGSTSIASFVRGELLR